VCEPKSLSYPREILLVRRAITRSPASQKWSCTLSISTSAVRSTAAPSPCSRCGTAAPSAGAATTLGLTSSPSPSAGSQVVGELVATNAGPRPVLLLEGELLEGGQQHRVAARTVVVPAQGALSSTSGASKPAVGRAPTGTPGRAGVPRCRSGPAATGASRRCGTRSVASATRTAPARPHRCSTRPGRSKTRRPSWCATCARSRSSPGCSSAFAGQPQLPLEVFDSPRTLAHAWRQLLKAVALDAVGQPTVPTPGRRARRFLDRLGGVEVTTGVDAGAGRQLIGASPYAEVAMTTWTDRMLHEVAVNPRHELVHA